MVSLRNRSYGRRSRPSAQGTDPRDRPSDPQPLGSMSRRRARALPSPAAGRDVSTVLRVRVRSTGAHWARVRARRAASSERVHSRHRPSPLLGVRAALRSTRVASRQPARHPHETRVARRGMSGTSSPQQARWLDRPVYPRRGCQKPPLLAVSSS